MLIDPESISLISDMDDADHPILATFLCFDEHDDEVDFIGQDHHLLKSALLDSSSARSTAPTCTQRKKKHKRTETEVQDSSANLIDQPSEHCVVFGRDKFAHKHPGNIFFRQLVSQLREDYQSTKVRKKKASITHHIINTIVSKGGRFLKMNCSENAQGWYQVDDAQVYEKVSHALRSAKPGCGKSSSMMMKKASSFINSPAIVMPVETPVQEGNFHDLMRRQSQILSSLKSGSATYHATQEQQQQQQSTNHSNMQIVQQQHPYPPFMPYHHHPSAYPYKN